MGLIALVNCQQVDITEVDAARIELSPTSATVAVSQTTRLTATVLSRAGQTLTGHAIEWTSLDATIASVDNTGMVRGIAAGSAKIRALVGQASDTASVTVVAASTIQLTPSEVTFSAVRNAGPPVNRTVNITNAGSGTLSGLSATVQYAAGEPTGWLTPALTSTTAPTTLILSVNQGSIAVGTYTATVNVSASGESSPLAVRLTVLAPTPAIALAATSVSFAAAQSGTNPDSQVVAVTNAGAGTLSGLSVSSQYVSGQPTGWLAAALSGTSAPATLTLRATTGTLAAGTYRATVNVSSPVAQNSPQAIDVTFTITIGSAPPPTQPTNLVATTISAVQINLSWNAASGTVTHYRIERKTGAGGTYAVLDSVAAGVTTYQNTGLLPATQYYYRVRACNAPGCSTPSSEAFATTGQTAPSVPTALNPTVVSSSQINLSWSASTGSVEKYRIERKTGAAGTYQPIDSVLASTTTYNNTGLVPATQYFYRVQACNAGGCSPFSTETSATTVPATPTGLTATAVSSARIDLNWTALAGTIDRYEIERGTVASGPFAPVQSVAGTTTNYQNVGLSAVMQYFYRVRACNTGGCSGYSATAFATTLTNPPGAPAGLTATALSTSQINLSWSAPATGTVDRYRIARRTGSNQFAVIDSVSAGTLTYQNTGLAPGTEYDYQVSACNAGGCSPYSATATATTPPTAPTGLTATGGVLVIGLSWTAATGNALEYRIERKSSIAPNYVEVARTSGTTHQDGLNLAPLIQYTYRVRACTAGGVCSAYSNEITVSVL